eukprot:5024044-Alexandrium_andersonii.AAC.1
MGLLGARSSPDGLLAEIRSSPFRPRGWCVLGALSKWTCLAELMGRQPGGFSRLSQPILRCML